VRRTTTKKAERSSWFLLPPSIRFADSAPPAQAPQIASIPNRRLRSVEEALLLGAACCKKEENGGSAVARGCPAFVLPDEWLQVGVVRSCWVVGPFSLFFGCGSRMTASGLVRRPLCRPSVFACMTRSSEALLPLPSVAPAASCQAEERIPKSQGAHGSQVFFALLEGRTGRSLSKSVRVWSAAWVRHGCISR
jgi:hypothetical protein